MKKLAVGVLLFALIAASVQVASAQPKVSGLVLQDITYEFGETAPYTFGRTLFRVNLSGDVSDNLSYYGRIQGNAGQPVVGTVKRDPVTNELTDEVTVSGSVAVAQAYGTLKNFGAEGLSVKLGRQFIGWSRLNSFGGFESTTIDGVSLNYSADAAGFDAYYKVNTPATPQQPASDEKVGARVTFGSDMGGLSLDLAGKVEANLTSAGGFGYGLSGSVGLGDIGDVYTELGKNAGSSASGFDYLVAGANISALEAATGISAWVEYDVNTSDYAFQLSRELVPGITLMFDGSNSGYSVTSELAVAF